MHQLIIFVGGVHGVGKTEFSKRASQEIGFAHLTASSLIREMGVNIEQGVKQVSSVSHNQDALIAALTKYKSIHKYILLDGHFCILDAHRHIQKIPMSTFREIKPRVIVLVTEIPEVIVGRLSIRDNNFVNLDFIVEFQNRELAHAKDVCSELNIPLLIRDSNISEHDIFANLLGYIW